jgi:predicted nuclease of restriction endonuclease-like (RecB) superfamily
MTISNDVQRQLPSPTGYLLDDLRTLIDAARSQAVQAVNTTLVRLYWSIGRRIDGDVLRESRAEYGQQIVATMSRQLTVEYGTGFSEKNLRRMVQMAQAFPDEEIVVTLSRQLSWSHFVALIPLKDPLKRDFYTEMCRVERWSVRTLRAKLDGMLFERTALSKKPEELIRRELDRLRDEDELSPDLVFQDPYLLDFLGLKGAYSEKDLEAAILRELESFLLELGTGFTFAARQKRITIDDEDYYLDLLFYHRQLRRLAALELKLGKLKAADKGQMELYLRWLDKYERKEGEETPIGLILCAEKSAEHVELLRLEESGIHVAEYMTELPPRDVLEKKLHDAIRAARSAIAIRKIDQDVSSDSASQDEERQR